MLNIEKDKTWICEILNDVKNGNADAQNYNWINKMLVTGFVENKGNRRPAHYTLTKKGRKFLEMEKSSLVQ